MFRKFGWHKISIMNTHVHIPRAVAWHVIVAEMEYIIIYVQAEIDNSTIENIYIMERKLFFELGRFRIGVGA